MAPSDHIATKLPLNFNFIKTSMPSTQLTIRLLAWLHATT